MYTSSIQQGQDYESLEKSIVILFSDYELDNLQTIEKYITKWNIKEEEYTRNYIDRCIRNLYN